jgi:DNA-binding winged helix-turn-helix (wHTH) protein
MAGNRSATAARFGNFELDLETRELRKSGTRLHLEDKPAQLLAILVENAPALLTRAELHAKLWPEGVYLDRDHGLNKCVNRLRLVLGDDLAHPRFIETLSRRGYRFVADVEFIQPGTAGNPAAVPTETPASSVSSELGEDFAVDVPAEIAAQRAPKQERSRSLRLWLLLAASALGLFLLVVTVVSMKWTSQKRHAAVISQGKPSLSTGPQLPPVTSVVLGTAGGFDPEDAGFQRHIIGNFISKPVHNKSRGGVNGLEITSDDQGYFFRPFTEAEKDFALRRDWKWICVCALKKGAAFADVDFGKDRDIPRFDINLLEEGNRYYVGLTQQISPELLLEKKIEFPGVADVEHPHSYELRYDHATQTASLWIDGKLAASDYHGDQQFRENRGIYFGAYAYRDSGAGIGIFQSVHFEAQ